MLHIPFIRNNIRATQRMLKKTLTSKRCLEIRNLIHQACFCLRGPKSERSRELFKSFWQKQKTCPLSGEFRLKSAPYLVSFNQQQSILRTWIYHYGQPISSIDWLQLKSTYSGSWGVVLDVLHPNLNRQLEFS